MRKFILLGLMAAASIVPSLASAQDRGDWRGRRGGDAGTSQPQGDGGQRGGGQRGGGDGGWRGRGGGNIGTATPAPAPAPRPEWRGNGGNGGTDNGGARFGGWRGRNGGDANADAQARAQAEAQARAQARGRDDRGGWGGRSRPDADGNGWRGRTDGGTPGGWRGRGDNGGFSNDQSRAQAEARARAERDRNWQGNRDSRWSGNDNRWQGGNRGGYNGDNRWRGNDGNRGRDWNRGWRGSNQYDWQRYRSSNRNVFRLPRYYAPYGWSYGYRRFSIGFTLESALFGRNYWIDDPYNYRLPDAYGEYRWVRYYNDALLVDIYSGEVVDVVYDIFY